MSNIDKQALRNLALRATPGPWAMEHENIWYCENGYTKHLAYFCQGDDVDDSQDDANTRYVAAADPSTVLALLDENESMARDLISRNGEIEGLRQRIAELEARTVTLPAQKFCPGEYMDSVLWSETEVWNQAISECAKAIRAAGIGKGE